MVVFVSANCWKENLIVSAHLNWAKILNNLPGVYSRKNGNWNHVWPAEQARRKLASHAGVFRGSRFSSLSCKRLRGRLGENMRRARGRRTCVRSLFIHLLTYLFVFSFIYFTYYSLYLFICLFIHFSFSTFNSWCALYSRETIVHKPPAYM